jgi:hypothetical protein
LASIRRGRKIDQNARVLSRRPCRWVEPHRKLSLRAVVGEAAVALDALAWVYSRCVCSHLPKLGLHPLAPR